MELTSNQVKALEMISAEFVDDIHLIREGIAAWAACRMTHLSPAHTWITFGIRC